MRLFRNGKSILSELREKPFKLEKEIQTLFEENLIGATGLLYQSRSSFLNSWYLQ